MTQQLMIFSQHHWALLLALLIVLVLMLSYDQLFGQAAKFGVTPPVAVTWINRDNAIVLDVRSQEAFRRAHIINAINIPANTLMNHLKQLNAYQKKPIILLGLNDQQAGKALPLIRDKVTPRVKILIGGMASWRAAGLPVDTA